jgi:hypothetical protein
VRVDFGGNDGVPFGFGESGVYSWAGVAAGAVIAEFRFQIADLATPGLGA